VHGTNEKNLPSIRRLGLLPGGTRGGRNHVHLALDCLLSTMNDALRPESDCILIARPGAVSDLNPVITQSRYLLTDQTIPFSRFCGVWSLVDRAWIDIPEPAELKRMNDYDSDIDLAMHICHHQLYWEKKNENELDNFTWTRSEYVEYVTEQINDIRTASKFLDCFRQATVGPSRPVRQTVTPNDQPRGPPETDDDRKINALRQELNGLRTISRKRRPRKCHRPPRAKCPKRKFRPRPCLRSRKVPQGRSNLQKHPIPDLPHLRREDTGVNP